MRVCAVGPDAVEAAADLLVEQGAIVFLALLRDPLLLGFEPCTEVGGRVARHPEVAIAFLPVRWCERHLRPARIVAERLPGELLVEADADSREQLDEPAEPYWADLPGGQALDNVINQQTEPRLVPRDMARAAAALVKARAPLAAEDGFDDPQPGRGRASRLGQVLPQFHRRRCPVAGDMADPLRITGPGGKPGDRPESGGDRSRGAVGGRGLAERGPLNLDSDSSVDDHVDAGAAGRGHLEIGVMPGMPRGNRLVLGLALVLVAHPGRTDHQPRVAAARVVVGAEQLVLAPVTVPDIDGAAAAAAPQSRAAARVAGVLQLGVGVRVNASGQVDAAAVGVDDHGLHSGSCWPAGNAGWPNLWWRGHDDTLPRHADTEGREISPAERPRY